MDEKKVNKEEKLVKIEVLPGYKHEDKGIIYTEGNTLEVDSSTARWLLDNKVGKLVN